MKDKLALSRSSYLVSMPVALVNLILSLVALLFGYTEISAVLIFLVLVAVISRVWASATIKNISIRLLNGEKGMFPGDTSEIEIEIINNKFLPIVWMEVYFPLSARLCMIPDNTREPDQWELVDLERHGSSVELVGEKKFSFILWYEKTKIVTKWYAQRRGIYSTDGWRMRTGDGFGLTQVERPVAGDKLHWFAVYPQIVDVNPDLFLRNVWNAETGTRGVMEDPTVIRSSREYALTDSMKRINWRLAARGLPLAVNVYEEILPKNVHFIFDGESFGGPDPHYREMEEALSIIASEILRLEEADVKCGISFCSGRVREAANIFDFASTEEKLFELAAYAPKAQAKDENNHIIKQLPIFDEAPILSAKHKTGRFYYVAYDTEDLSKVNLLHSLDNSCVSILTYTESATYGEFETVCLSRLKEGKEDVR